MSPSVGHEGMLPQENYEFVDVGFFSRCEGMAHHLRTLWGIFRVVRHARNLLKFCPSVCGGCNMKVEAFEAVF